MKKFGFLNLAAARQQTQKASSWKFGWSASSVDAAIEERRTFSQRSEKHGSGVYGLLVSKAYIN